MGIKTQKVLRLISKIILILVGVGLVGIAGYYVYKSIAFKPQNVVVTNITDGSATVTWTTTSPMKGIVYVKKDKGLLPGPLGIVGSSMAYDDRDVSDAQKTCVDVFNKKASETKDSTFSVSGSNFDCENVKVTKMGSYYTHSVTVTDLDENSTYNFVVGDGIWSFKESVSTVKTFSVLETIGEPKPIFGKVVGDDETVSEDGLVYITFNDGSEGKDSIVYSSTTNDDGGWYVDASSVRDSNGNVISLELTNDSFKAKGVYKNYGSSDEQMWVLGYFNDAYPDIVVKKNIPVSFLRSLLVGKAFAACGNIPDPKDKTKTILDLSTCPKDKNNPNNIDPAIVKQLGYGNVAKALVREDGKFLSGDLSKLGLAINAGNLNALISPGIETFKVGESVSSGVAIEYKDGLAVASLVCKGKQLCRNGVCAEKAGECGVPVEKVPDSPKTPVCSPIDCTPTGQASSIMCVDGVVKSYSNSSCSSSGTGSEQNSIGLKCRSRNFNDCGTGKICVDKKCTSARDATQTSCGGYAIDHCEKSGENQYKICTSAGWAFGTGTCDGVGGSNTTAGSFSCDENRKCAVTFGDQTVTVTSTQMKKILNESYTSGDGVIVASNIDINKFLKFGGTNAANIVSDNLALKEVAIKELSIWEEEVTKYTAGTVPDITDKIKALCDALGGTTNNSYNPTNCTLPETQNLNPFKPSRVYAADSSSDSYTLYMPEYGMYSFQLGNYTVSTEVSDGNTIYLFYIETNGKEGFQIPIDPDNPTSEEDIILNSASYQITYKQESTAQQYEIKKGINIISFDFVPVSIDSGAYSAQDIIIQASDNGVEIQYISTFEGGRWNSGYSCSSGTCTGNNFTIVPGKGYLVYATEDGTVTIPGYNLTSSVPVAFSAGWNLVGVHGYTTAYTARSFIDSINKIEGLTANNVSWWPTSKSKYEGLEVDNGTQYGLDYSISPNNGYFVRISKFAPTDTKCKSLIWNAGGSLNGSCGNTK